MIGSLFISRINDTDYNQISQYQLNVLLTTVTMIADFIASHTAKQDFSEFFILKQ